MQNVRVLLLIQLVIIPSLLFSYSSGQDDIRDDPGETVLEMDRCGIAIVPFVTNDSVRFELQYGISWDVSSLTDRQERQEFFSINLDNVQNGAYTLKVNVTDKSTDLCKTVSVGFTITG